MFRSRAAQILTVCAALALATAESGDYARAQGRLEASYGISLAHIRVGEITATLVLGDSDYTISAQARAGGIMKVLIEGEGSFTTRGNIKDGHPLPTNFTSKIVSRAASSDVAMVLEDGSVKELVATPPPPSSGIVPVTEANRQSIIDPLSAMLVSVCHRR